MNLKKILLGAAGVQAVRSQSTAGLNVVYIEFDWDTEIRAARQTVQPGKPALTRCRAASARPSTAHWRWTPQKS